MQPLFMRRPVQRQTSVTSHRGTTHCYRDSKHTDMTIGSSNYTHTSSVLWEPPFDIDDIRICEQAAMLRSRFGQALARRQRLSATISSSYYEVRSSSRTQSSLLSHESCDTKNETMGVEHLARASPVTRLHEMHGIARGLIHPVCPVGSQPRQRQTSLPTQAKALPIRNRACFPDAVASDDDRFKGTSDSIEDTK
jgi:hypothetical protein